MSVSFFTRRRILTLTSALALVCFFAISSLSHPVHAAQAAPVSKKLIKQGKSIFDHTPDKASKYVGSSLTCTNCHLNSGTTQFAAPMNIAKMYPVQKDGKKVTLEDVIQRCFARSENGKPLPADSPEMNALVAYINSLSKNEVAGQAPKGRGFVQVPALTGDVTRGASIYQTQCIMCHEANGAGIPGTFPPLWGPKSYNDAASMDKVPVMAAFILHNMPQTSPGSLSAQQAFDVAAFIHSKPHPKFNPGQ